MTLDITQARQQFEAKLSGDGFQETVIKEFLPGYEAAPHTHDFDVEVLVAKGRFILTRDGRSRAYGPGESFAFPAGKAHSEEVGPAGATLIIGRRHPADYENS